MTELRAALDEWSAAMDMAAPDFRKHLERIGLNPDPLAVDDEPWTPPLPTWPRHDPATGFGLALIVGAVVGLVVLWRWWRG